MSTITKEQFERFAKDCFRFDATGSWREFLVEDVDGEIKLASQCSQKAPALVALRKFVADENVRRDTDVAQRAVDRAFGQR